MWCVVVEILQRRSLFAWKSEISEATTVSSSPHRSLLHLSCTNLIPEKRKDAFFKKIIWSGDMPPDVHFSQFWAHEIWKLLEHVERIWHALHVPIQIAEICKDAFLSSRFQCCDIGVSIFKELVDRASCPSPFQVLYIGILSQFCTIVAIEEWLSVNLSCMRYNCKYIIDMLVYNLSLGQLSSLRAPAEHLQTIFPNDLRTTLRITSIRLYYLWINANVVIKNGLIPNSWLQSYY